MNLSHLSLSGIVINKVRIVGRGEGWIIVLLGHSMMARFESAVWQLGYVKLGYYGHVNTWVMWC